MLIRNRDYLALEGDDEGAVLLVVRENSLIKSVADLAPFLDRVRDVLRRLQSFNALQPNFLSLLLGLDTLIEALDLQPKFQFQVGDHGDLSEIVFSKTPWRVFPPQWGSSVHAEDMASSLIILGVKTGLETTGWDFWGDDNFCTNDQHKFVLGLFVGQECWVEIRNLRVFGDAITTFPPKGEGMPHGVPQKPWVDFYHDPSWPGDLDDKLSSISFRGRRSDPRRPCEAVRR